MDKKLKIVILDGFTAAQNDLDWKIFDSVADVVCYDRTPKDKIVERAEGADAIFSNKVPLFREQLEKLPDVKYISILATGYNNLDVKYAAERGIVATNIPAYSTDSVAQLVFAHILNIANRVAAHADWAAAGNWCKAPDMTYLLTDQVELAGMTLGIVGLGTIGKRVAEIAKAFSMRTIAYSPSKTPGQICAGTEIVTLDQLLAQSHIISLNCLLNDDTRHIINAESLSKCKDGVWIINTGRGPLIDEYALAQALKSSKVAYAGLDVLSTEPPSPQNPLIGLQNCFLTPHIAWATRSARKRLIKICFDNFMAWLNGSPINRIN